MVINHFPTQLVYRQGRKAPSPEPPELALGQPVPCLFHKDPRVEPNVLPGFKSSVEP